MYLVKWVEMDSCLCYHAMVEVYPDYDKARDRKTELEEHIEAELIRTGNLANGLCSEIEITKLLINLKEEAMISFHGVTGVKVTEPKTYSGGYTNEIIVQADDREYKIDLFAEHKNCLRVSSDQILTLRSILKEITEDSLN